MTLLYYPWLHCITNDSTALPVTPLCYLWFQSITCDSTVLSVTPLYYQWLHCINCDSNLSPVTPIYYPRLHCITCNSTVLPVTPLYYLWLLLVLHLSQLRLQHPVFTILLQSTHLLLQTQNLSQHNPHKSSSPNHRWCTTVLIRGKT